MINLSYLKCFKILIHIYFIKLLFVYIDTIKICIQKYFKSIYILKSFFSPLIHDIKTCQICYVYFLKLFMINKK